MASSIKQNDNQIYEIIRFFMDDNIPEAVGKIQEFKNFVGVYDEAFCGIGNNELRSKLMTKLEKMKFKIPILIHLTAYISPSGTTEKELLWN